MSNNFKDKTFWLEEDIFFIQIDGKAMLVDLNKKCHYDPNESACILLDVIGEKGGAHFNDLKEHLKKNYDFDDDEKAEKAVIDFLSSPPPPKQIGEKGGLTGLFTSKTTPLGTPKQVKKSATNNWEEPQVVSGGSTAVLSIGSTVSSYRG